MRVLVGCEFSGIVREAFAARGHVLVPTNIVDGRYARVHREPPGPNRWRNRSRTLSGVAQAIAEQWGGGSFQVDLPLTRRISGEDRLPASLSGVLCCG